VALTSVAPIPLLLIDVEKFLAGRALTVDTLEDAACLAAEACSPIDDVRGSARYRKHMVKNLTLQALCEVLETLGNPVTQLPVA